MIDNLDVLAFGAMFAVVAFQLDRIRNSMKKISDAFEAHG